MTFALPFWAAPALAQEGRDPDDHWEIEGHLGFYWNVKFPENRAETAAYTTYLNANVAPAFQPLFRPDLRSRNSGWHGGVRMSYDFQPRWGIEYSLDVSQSGNFRFNDAYLGTVVPAAQVAIPTLTVRRLRTRGGRVWIHHINLVFNARDRGRVVPYITGGFNAATFGRGPLIDFIDTAVSDVGVFGYEHRHTRIGGNIGGGVKIYASRHFGVRGDIRFLFLAPEFSQGGFAIVAGNTFGPSVVSQQRGLYSNLQFSFGVFGRF